MESFIVTATQLRSQMDAALQAGLPTLTHQLNCADASRAIKIVHEHLAPLIAAMEQCEREGHCLFKEVAEEIVFFKEIKPGMFSQLNFYTAVLTIRSNMPLGPQKLMEAYLESELDSIHAFYQHNRELVSYYRQGNTGLDEKYFCRLSIDTKLSLGLLATEPDDFFSTGFDKKLARLMAYEQLQQWLEAELALLRADKGPILMNGLENPLQWTGPKVSLVELIYALQATDYINKGNASLKQIASLLALAFNTELSDYSHMFLEIRRRKKGYTTFLDNLKAILEKRIEEAI
jgi:hypothetical protein